MECRVTLMKSRTQCRSRRFPSALSRFLVNQNDIKANSQGKRWIMCDLIRPQSRPPWISVHQSRTWCWKKRHKKDDKNRPIYSSSDPSPEQQTAHYGFSLSNLSGLLKERKRLKKTLEDKHLRWQNRPPANRKEYHDNKLSPLMNFKSLCLHLLPWCEQRNRQLVKSLLPPIPSLTTRQTILAHWLRTFFHLFLIINYLHCLQPHFSNYKKHSAEADERKNLALGFYVVVPPPHSQGRKFLPRVVEKIIYDVFIIAKGWKKKFA